MPRFEWVDEPLRPGPSRGDQHTWGRPTEASEAEFGDQCTRLESGMCPKCANPHPGRIEFDSQFIGRVTLLVCGCSPGIGYRAYTYREGEGNAHQLWEDGDTLLQEIRVPETRKDVP